MVEGADKTPGIGPGPYPWRLSAWRASHALWRCQSQRYWPARGQSLHRGLHRTMAVSGARRPTLSFL